MDRNMTLQNVRASLVQLGFTASGQDQRPSKFLEANASLIRRFVLRSKTDDRIDKKLFTWETLGEAMHFEFGISNSATGQPYRTKELSKKWAEFVGKLEPTNQAVVRMAAGHDDKKRREAAIASAPQVNSIAQLRTDVLTAISDLKFLVNGLFNLMTEPQGSSPSPAAQVQENAVAQTVNVKSLRESAAVLLNNIKQKEIHINSKSNGAIEIKGATDIDDIQKKLTEIHNSVIKNCIFLLSETPEIHIDTQVKIYFRDIYQKMQREFQINYTEIFFRKVSPWDVTEITANSNSASEELRQELQQFSVEIFNMLLLHIAIPRRISVL